MIPKSIVFDFDGVLTVLGEGLKQNAWNLLAKPWGVQEHNRLLIEQQTFGEGKGSRFDILRETFSHFTSNSAKDVLLLTSAYSVAYNFLVQEMILSSGMPEDTEKVLNELVRVCPLYVNSATPEEGVIESAKTLKISAYFSGIFGQPKSKLENLKRVAQNEKCKPEEMVFVGDGNGDHKASVDFGCSFIGISNEWNAWVVGKGSFTVVSHLRDIPKVIGDL